MNLLEDVNQRRRHSDSVAHGKTKSVRLTNTVIWILSDDYHFQRIEIAAVKGTKDLFAGRKNSLGLILLFYKLNELLEVWLIEFVYEFAFPAWGNFNIHMTKTTGIRQNDKIVSHT